MSFKAPGEVRSLNWSNDGNYLLVAGTFNTPIIKRVWQSTEELIQYAIAVSSGIKLDYPSWVDGSGKL